MDPACWLWERDPGFWCQVPEETSPHLLLRISTGGKNQDEPPSGRTGISYGNCQETDTRTVLAWSTRNLTDKLQRVQNAPPGLLCDAVGNITSLQFSSPFTGFQYHVGFGTRARLCVIAPFLKVVPGICQNYWIMWIITHPLVSFAHLLTASRFVYQLQTERLSEKGPSPSLVPLSGTVSRLTLAPYILLLHSERLLKHLFKSCFVSNKIQPLLYSHSHHHASNTLSSPVIMSSIPPALPHIYCQSL